MADARGRLIAFRADRLGARLISLVNTLRLSAIYKLPFKVHWQEATDVGHVFNDPTELFDADFVARHFIDREEWVRRRPDSLRIMEVGRQGAEHLSSVIADGTDVTVDQAFGIQVLKGEDPDRVRTDFQRVVRQMPWSEALKAPLATAEAALAGATAYHIRRGDLTDSPKAMNKPWPHKMVPNEVYEAHMDRALGEGGAVLFSDDAATLEHYRARFPGLRTIHQIVDTAPLTEAQRDLLELYAMSRCAKIIAPERSAFSSTARDLGDAVKLDVAEDLSDDMARAAQEALVTRLTDRPDSFAGEGEIGQCLAHAARYLEAEERWHDGATLLARHIADGLNIAFVYPDAMRFQHRAGDVSGVLNTGQAMLSRPLLNSRYFIEAEILHGYGHIRAGDRATGLRHIVNAFWHGPGTGAARQLLPALVEIGLLDATNFLPVSAVQLGLRRRRGPMRALVTDYPHIMALAGKDLPRDVGELETAVWDWLPLLRGVSLKAALQKGDVAAAREALMQAELDPAGDIDRHGMLALFDAFEEKGGATDRLEALTRAHPQHLMSWQRLSHAHWLARDYQKAAEAAARAAALAPDAPAVLAWAGMMHLRARDNAAALAVLAPAAEAEIGLPIIPALLAQALEHHARPEDALTAIEAATRLAPMESDFALHQARLLEALGRRAEAIRILTTTVDCLRATARVFGTLVRLLNEAGDADRAAEMVRTAQERFPDHPAMQKLRVDDAA